MYFLHCQVFRPFRRNETLQMRFTEVCGNRGNIIRRNIIRLINWNRIYIGLFIYKDLLLNKS